MVDELNKVPKDEKSLPSQIVGNSDKDRKDLTKNEVKNEMITTSVITDEKMITTSVITDEKEILDKVVNSISVHGAPDILGFVVMSGGNSIPLIGIPTESGSIRKTIQFFLDKKSAIDWITNAEKIEIERQEKAINKQSISEEEKKTLLEQSMIIPKEQKLFSSEISLNSLRNKLLNEKKATDISVAVVGSTEIKLARVQLDQLTCYNFSYKIYENIKHLSRQRVSSEIVKIASKIASPEMLDKETIIKADNNERTSAIVIDLASSAKAFYDLEHPPDFNRNDPCPCNSGKKFKKCCISIPECDPIDLRKNIQAVNVLCTDIRKSSFLPDIGMLWYSSMKKENKSHILLHGTYAHSVLPYNFTGMIPIAFKIFLNKEYSGIFLTKGDLKKIREDIKNPKMFIYGSFFKMSIPIKIGDKLTVFFIPLVGTLGIYTNTNE